MTATIPLTKGYSAIVDEEDYERLNVHKWHVAVKSSTRQYAQRKEQGRMLLMHHEVLKTAQAVCEIDHINRNGLDNRKENLRVSTRSENMLNRVYVKEAKLIDHNGYSYRARARRAGKNITIGHFKTLEEAEEAVRRFKANG